MREIYSRRLLCICVISILYLLPISPIQSVAQVEHDDLTGVKVAIYNGTGVMYSSHMALSRMFEWMNASVANVNTPQILDDSLDDFDILVVSGGSETLYNSELDSEGKQKVKDFVTNGGSYFGICGGATFGVTYLRFFSGFMSPVNEPGLITHMTIMNVNQSSLGPDLSDCSANFTTLYYASQYFFPSLGTAVHIVATYEYNDEAGMIAFKYGNGTVFLSSPHPEYEENDDRDGTTFYSNYDDPDSEWDLLLRVSKWLIEASYADPSDSNTTLDLPLIAVIGTGGALVVLVVVVLYRRMHR